MTVLFVSENPIERAENLRCVYEAYRGDKLFERGWESYRNAAELGYSAVVIDTMPPYMPSKSCPVVFVGHGISGDKLYGFDQPVRYVDERVRGQIDFAISASDDPQVVGILARQTGARQVVPLGFPRTDRLVGSRGMRTCCRRTYLYAPTFRGGYERAPLPTLDWRKVDGLLGDDELLVVKRHYYTIDLICGDMEHVHEAWNMEPSTDYVIGCDALVTDFSSIMFDAYVAGKPVVLAVDGMDGYLAERGMCFDYPRDYAARWLEIGHSEEHFVDFVRAAAEDGMTAFERRVRDKFANMCDGHSTERVVEFVRGLL